MGRQGLLDQREHALGLLVGLGQHGGGRLLDDLGLGQRGRGRGVVCVHDRAARGGNIGRDIDHIVRRVA